MSNRDPTGQSRGNIARPRSSGSSTRTIASLPRQPTSTNNRVLAVNAAFDRPHFRFGEKEEDTLLALAGALDLAEQSGWTIVNVLPQGFGSPA
ncbi:hypothetical protein [uncultured Cohaesibacter sp.]|uniref:hypothetical protein n=1 Tax=uncultured Cohaesibacter sp. TaxID=1002546 RepID=UPI0029C8A51F|nr:hypothetical protein [uncultured Cohaesibacter sp.]